MSIARSATELPNIQINWPAYYAAFCEKHERDPVVFKGRLLFRDGWTYSSTDYAGPEYPPPEDKDQLYVLQQAYWKVRRFVVKRMRDQLRLTVKSLKELQYGKDAPLQQIVSTLNEETGKRTAQATAIDIDAIEAGRLAWLEMDVQECDERLAELKEQHERQPLEELSHASQ